MMLSLNNYRFTQALIGACRNALEKRPWRSGSAGSDANPGVGGVRISPGDSIGPSSVARQGALSIVSGGTVERILREHRGDVVRLVREAYLAHDAGKSANPQSVFLRFPERPDARIIALPALDGASNVAGLKWVSSFPSNLARGMSRASAVQLLADPDTGWTYAMLESTAISAARTAASAVLAADVMTAGDRRPETIGVVGNGPIARAVLDFMEHGGWRFRRILLYDRDPMRAEGFRARLPPEQRSVCAASSDLPTLMGESELILFATNASSPHVTDPTLVRHNPLILHISLRDLSPSIILASQNVVDDTDHALRERTSLHLAEQATGHRDFVTGTLAGLINGRYSLEGSRPRIFSPFGMGILDVAVSNLVYEIAASGGETVRIDNFHSESVDW